MLSASTLQGKPASTTVEAPLLEIRNLTRSYGETRALRGVSLQVMPGAIVCLLGPSGCGKTTLLRVIAGLEHADAGEVLFAGQSINDIPAHRRGFGLMFQEYALFPHRSVAENVAFGLRMAHMPRPQIAARVAEMLTLVGLEGYDRRRVYELSGGERQRVALARSLAPSPRLLMLDEPLGALDRTLRERLLEELRAILKRVGVTSIYVTHDQTEAFAVADWLVLMQAGQIEQQGPPEAIYRRPATIFAARFLGLNNLVDGCVREAADDGLIVETALGPLQIEESGTTIQAGEQVTVVIRPEAASLAADTVAERTNRVRATLSERSFRGSRTRLTVRHQSGLELEFESGDPDMPSVGEVVTLELHAAMMSLITADRAAPPTPALPRPS